jgi:cell wall-associated NlpC family hydrolase
VNIRARERYIARRARALGLDPKAVLAIAAHEGLSGGVGDGGHAFGPFQLNDAGGVLTNHPASHHSNQWAWSNEGINYALAGIAKVAKGLKGKAAVTAIATRFERPQDPQGEIADAMAHYGKMGSFGGPGQIVSAGRKQVTRFDQETFRKQAGALLMQSAVEASQGNLSAASSLGSSLEAARKAATIRMKVNADGSPDHGPGGGGLGEKLVKTAAKQLGQPYVWGGESRAEGGFDCSGLIQWAASQLGIKLPRVAADQGRAGHGVAYKNIRPGDLLVAKDGHHVVMYAGKGKVIAAPHTGTTVQWQPLSYFPPSQYKARRIVG